MTKKKREREGSKRFEAREKKLAARRAIDKQLGTNKRLGN